MAFQVCKAVGFMQAGLAEGEVGLDRRGQLTMRHEDADKLKLEHFATILADPENRRVAIRAPRPGENNDAVAVSVTDGGRRRRVHLRRALTVIGVAGDAVKGRYSLMFKDGMGIVVLDVARAVPALHGRRESTEE